MTPTTPPTTTLALAAGLALTLTSAAALAADLPIRSITMHRSGVASVERGGTVDGHDTVTLTFGTDQINDVLKSLVFADAQGGTLTRVGYGAREPLRDRLASFGLDIGDNPNVPDLINRLRGERLRLDTPEGSIEGTVLGVEHRKQAAGAGDAVVTTYHAKLLTDLGVIRVVPLDTLRGMEILDETLAAELREALALLAEGRTERTADLSLDLHGTGTRDIAVGYVQEAPVWKTSYRVVLPEDGSTDGPLVQGWAIVENTTDEDWEDVRLSLVAGQPVGFTMDLAEPVFAPRRELPVPVLAGADPRTFAAGKIIRREVSPIGSGGVPAAIDSDFARETLARGAMEQATMASSPALVSSIMPVADAVDDGRVFRFDLAEPVTIERRGSAMLPILAAPVEGRSVSVFTPGTSTRPMRAVELENTSGSPLMAGPVAVYDNGTYAGDAPLDYIAAGETRMLGYAVDLDVTADTDRSMTSDIIGVRISGGVLIRTTRQRNTIDYELTNRDAAEGRTLIVEHPARPGWDTTASTDASETTPTHIRYELTLTPDSEATLEVVEQRTTSQRVQLIDTDMDQLAQLVRGAAASRAVVEAIAEAGRMRDAIRAAERAIESLEEEERAIFRDQDRINKNLARVRAGGELHTRYIRTLDEQETRLAELRDEIDTQEATRDRERERLLAYLRDLNVE